MQDVELYSQILGIQSPWRVSKVELRAAEGKLHVFVEDTAAELPCPTCGALRPVHDRARERTWRHLDSCHLQTILHARPPRVSCDEHGIHQVALPWAEPRSRFTALFERLAIDVLRESSVDGARRILGISWDEAFGIMMRAVARGMLRRGEVVSRYIGIDEKAIQKRHKYLSIVTDLKTGTALWVGEDRKRSTLDSFWSSRSDNQIAGIEAVAMDMWQPYYASTLSHLPNAIDKIVFDKFHVMQHATKSVDDVRRTESFALQRVGDSRLNKTRWMWTYASENLPQRYADAFAILKRQTLQTGKAWMLKENLRYFWSQPDRDAGRAFLTRWIRWAKRQGLRPVERVADLVKTHAPNLLTYFRHRITNAAAESLNSVVDKVKRRAAGFRNVNNFKAAIYFHCGGLDLYPRTALAT